MLNFVETMADLDRLIQKMAACGNYAQLAKFAKLADQLRTAQLRLEVAIFTANEAVEMHDTLQATFAEADAEEAAAASH